VKQRNAAYSALKGRVCSAKLTKDQNPQPLCEPVRVRARQPPATSLTQRHGKQPRRQPRTTRTPIQHPIQRQIPTRPINPAPCRRTRRRTARRIMTHIENRLINTPQPQPANRRITGATLQQHRQHQIRSALIRQTRRLHQRQGASPGAITSHLRRRNHERPPRLTGSGRRSCGQPMYDNTERTVGVNSLSA